MIDYREAIEDVFLELMDYVDEIDTETLEKIIELLKNEGNNHIQTIIESYNLTKEEPKEKVAEKEPVKNWDDIFIDNEKGAIEALKAMSEGIDFTDVEAIPDPQVEGVWKVFTPKMHCNWIVYLKGYKEPFGNIRKENDFEDCDNKLI